MANATYEFMRANSRSEMLRAVGAKAVAGVELALPQTLAAGDRSVQSESGSATSVDDSQEGGPEG